MKLSKFVNGRANPVTHVDIAMVCAHGHMLWYTPQARADKCDMRIPEGLDKEGYRGSVVCGLPIRALTDAEEAARLIGGYAAVAAIATCGK